jgi:type VI secretion system protein ImpI/type VI secretion system protein
MIRCPDHVAPERREVRGGEFSIGRGKENQWVVADADRHLSKRHCQFVYAAGEWELHDLSTNGTFINDAGDPIGKGASRKLRHGDRIKFGLYEIEVSLDADPTAAEHDHFGAYDPSGSTDLPSRSEYPPYHGGARSPDSASMTDVPGSPILPADFDPLAPGHEPFAGPTEPDHAPALQSAFRPPQPVSIIPDDWDIDLPAAGQRPPTPHPEPPQQPPEGAAPPATPAISEAVRPATLAAAPISGAANDSEVTGALLRGLALEDTVLRDPEKTMESLGAAVRATVSGLRQILMARASIKDEFRIEQTVIRASGNNPLKFSLDDDDALATLLGIGRNAGMPAAHAITEAFEDLRMHELATITAMQAAVRVLLAQFDPDSIERNAGSGGLQIHPAQKKARAWEAFAQRHAKVTQALSDDFDSVFGKAFARAYEEAIEKLNAEKETS